MDQGNHLKEAYGETVRYSNVYSGGQSSGPDPWGLRGDEE
jgi:hypothetical protein